MVCGISAKQQHQETMHYPMHTNRQANWKASPTAKPTSLPLKQGLMCQQAKSIPLGPKEGQPEGLSEKTNLFLIAFSTSHF